jgi:hypothetical protein
MNAGMYVPMEPRLKILFITDSLAFPRAEPELVRYDETYLARLKALFPNCDFIHQGRGGATIVDLYKHTNYFHGTIAPDLVFMHSGVVDCAPRALTVIEQQILSRLPLVGRPLGELVRRHARTLRRLRNMTYTPMPVFAQYVRHFEALFPTVYWIGILPVAPQYDAKIEGMARNVGSFNEVLRGCRYVDTSGIDPETMIMSDFHHLNAAGHAHLTELLGRTIRHHIATAEAIALPSRHP